MKTPPRPVHGLAVPTAHPLTDTKIGAQNNFSDWRIGERAEAQRGHGSAERDLRHSPREVIG